MNLARWEFTQDHNTPPWSMDARHVDMIAAVVLLSGIERAVEIGCLNGRSTTAFVEAVEAGAKLRWLGLCDLVPTVNAARVAKELAPIITVETTALPSTSIEWTADLWVIDGAHDYDSVRADVAVARSHGAKIIVMHDTTHRQFDGPSRVLAEIAAEFFAVFTDSEKRPGEETERGIAFLFTGAANNVSACLAKLKSISHP